MIPVAFEYEAPRTVEDALSALTRHGDEAKILAGGQSLLPLLKLRLASPEVLVDLGRIDGLRGISAEKDGLDIGAMVRYVDLELSPLVQERAPLLADAARLVGDAQVRNRGTLGGAMAHADPAGDMPAVALAMDMTVTITSPQGERSVGAGDFFLDIFETSLQPHEILTGLRVPAQPRSQSYQKFRHRSADWAIVGAAASVWVDNGVIADIRVALSNVGPTAVRATRVEDALRGHAFDPQTVTAASALASQDINPVSEYRAPSEFKRHLARVMTERAILAAIGRNGDADS